MFNYKTLENINIDTLHRTFVNAFSDYQVKIDLPLWKFQNMLQRRGFVSGISVGAFKDGVLVGFVLNGHRNWKGISTVYDIGTGVIGEYRKQGITSNMLLYVKGLLGEKGVHQYLLEVLNSNESAIQLYKKQGFEAIRDFQCFRLDKNMYSPITTCKVEHVEGFGSTDWKRLMNIWDYTPSWQNSIDSINAVKDSFIYSLVRLDNMIVGYGIIDKKTGDIAQIAVDKHYRRKGFASSIVTDLLKNTEAQKVSVLNVVNEAIPTKDFLLKLGFEYGVGQYEMILEL